MEPQHYELICWGWKFAKSNMLLSLTMTYAMRHQRSRWYYKSNCLNCHSIFPLYVNSWYVTIDCQNTHNISRSTVHSVQKIMAKLALAGKTIAFYDNGILFLFVILYTSILISYYFQFVCRVFFNPSTLS